MRRLCALILALCLTFSAFTAIAVVVGGRLPLPERLAILHLTDCASPCWIGIVPGTTTLEEAKTRIEEVYGQSSNYTLSFLSSTDTLTAQIALKQEPKNFVSVNFQTKNTDKINLILFRFNDADRPSIADYFATVGTPTYLFFAPRLQDISTMFYDLFFFEHECSIIVGGTYPTDQIDWSQQPGTLVFQQPTLCKDGTSRWQAWRGFRRMNVSFR